jgi:hypothetical protein
MKSLCVLILLVASCVAQTCYEGDLYLFTEDSGIYQSNSNNGSISTNGFDTNCIPNAVTSSVIGETNYVLLSCYESAANYAPTIKTITENKVISAVFYKTPCSINPITYDDNNGKQHLRRHFTYISL